MTRKTSKIDMKLLFEIFMTFFKISPFTFGGGFAMVPILELEMVKKKKWVDSEKIVDIFAVSQSVPGAIGVNSATFLGYQIAGVPGAIAATLGIVSPTFVIIIVLAVLLASFQNNIHVQAALKGIRPTVIALIALAAYKMGKTSIKDKASFTICAAAVSVLLIFKSLSIVILIFAGAMIGIFVTKVKSVISNNAENNYSTDSYGKSTDAVDRDHALSGGKL